MASFIVDSDNKLNRPQIPDVKCLIKVKIGSIVEVANRRTCFFEYEENGLKYKVRMLKSEADFFKSKEGQEVILGGSITPSKNSCNFFFEKEVREIEDKHIIKTTEIKELYKNYERETKNFGLSERGVARALEVNIKHASNHKDPKSLMVQIELENGEWDIAALNKNEFEDGFDIRDLYGPNKKIYGFFTDNANFYILGVEGLNYNTKNLKRFKEEMKFPETKKEHQEKVVKRRKRLQEKTLMERKKKGMPHPPTKGM